jgi:hypothetical protein
MPRLSSGGRIGQVRFRWIIAEMGADMSAIPDAALWMVQNNFSVRRQLRSLLDGASSR